MPDMRARISATPLTPDEEKEKAKLRTQEQANAFFEKRKVKLAEQYRIESTHFREKGIPEMRAAYDKRRPWRTSFKRRPTASANCWLKISRTSSWHPQTAKMIEKIEAACLPIVVGDMSAVMNDPQSNFKEMVETIVLLFELAGTQRRVTT